MDYLVPLNFHIDHLLFRRKLELPGLYPPNEMAPNTALDFLLCGLALLCFEKDHRQTFCPSQLFIVPAALIAVLALFGYSYRELVFYRVGTTLPMSIDTALAFTLFCLGFLAAQPDRGIMRVLTSRTTGGTMARRLLPMAIIIPWVLGGLILVFEQGGYYGPEFAISIFAVTCILLFFGLIWWNARLAYLNDLSRLRARRRRAAQHDCTRALAESSNLGEVMPRILQILAEGLDWQVAIMWNADTVSGTLRCSALWQSPAFDRQEFLTATRVATLAKGVGLAGRVWAAGQPVWLKDAATDPDSTTQRAAQAGLHGALGFPLLAGEELLGVIEFFSVDSAPRDEAVLEVLSTVGAQINLLVERTRAEDRLRKTSAELVRSNTDLQQFAYLASHDLFEPLRMITSYLQLLNERYASKLDRQAHEFIGFAVDGATRMNALIHDLLAYARVDLRGRAFGAVDCEKTFDAAIANLKLAIEENGTTISRGPLPTVLGDPVQLTQLFQNLLGNAIKFRGSQPPRIDIDAQLKDGEWLFVVRDNGIGIDPKHFDRIFVIFQRLHTRQQYGGTGMGLAICKRIVERHGGRIWVESTPGDGSCFYFTLPVMKDQCPAENQRSESGKMMSPQG